MTLPEMMSDSFLTIYTYINIYESSKSNQCIEYALQLAESSLYQIFHTDIRVRYTYMIRFLFLIIIKKLYNIFLLS